MKLRDRFEQLEEFDEDKCIEIAENFAIGFAEFCRDGEKNTEFWYKEITIKELLEIYKKTL